MDDDHAGTALSLGNVLGPVEIGFLLASDAEVSHIFFNEDTLHRGRGEGAADQAEEHNDSGNELSHNPSQG